MQNLPICQGSPVTLLFTITLEDGTVVEATGDEPFEFVMGDGTLIEGLELALLGLRPGDTQTIDLPPREAFGFPVEGEVHTLPRDQFDASMQLERGQIIGFTTPGGDEVPGIIRELADDEVVVDFNHPLAGHRITFAVEIIDVGPSTLLESRETH